MKKIPIHVNVYVCICAKSTRHKMNVQKGMIQMEQEFKENQTQNKINLNLQEINRYNSQYYRPIEMASNNNEKLEAFKRRLDGFKKVYTLEDAKELLNKTMPVQLVRTTFIIGDAKCTIINRHDQLRICLKTPTEIICYDFR